MSVLMGRWVIRVFFIPVAAKRWAAHRRRPYIKWPPSSHSNCESWVWRAVAHLMKPARSKFGRFPLIYWIAAEWIYCFWAARLTELTSGFYFSSWCHTPLGDNSRRSNPRPATAACCWAGFSEINTLHFVCMCEKKNLLQNHEYIYKYIFCDDSGPTFPLDS